MAPRKTSAVKKAPGTRRIRVKSASEPVVPKVKKEIVFEHVKVLKILPEGHTKTHFHCHMSNGTYMHVPKKLF